MRNVNPGQCKRVMKGHIRGVVTMEYSPSQRILVSAGFDHDILVWSPVAGQVTSFDLVASGRRERKTRAVPVVGTWRVARGGSRVSRGSLSLGISHH